MLFSIDEINLGCSTSVMGINRELGSELVKGTNLYINYINSLNGINGRRIKFTYYNDWYNPRLTIRNTKKLNDSYNVDILLNYSGTPTVISILPYLKLKEKENLILFSPISGTSAIRTAPFNNFVYNIRKSYDDEAKNIVSVINKKSLSSVGIFYQIDGFGRSCFTSINNYLKEAGNKIKSEVTYKRGIHYFNDMETQVRELLLNDLDVIITVGYDEAVSAFIRDVRKIKPFIPIFSFSFSTVDSVLEILLREKTPVNDLYFSQVLPHFTETKYEAIKNYNSQVKANGQTATMISMEAFLNTNILIEKLTKTTQEINRENIKSIVFNDDNFSKEIKDMFNRVYIYKVISENELKEVYYN